ncbi:hypothetical protein AGDE_10341 [Angomonas deanei]|uniref:Vps54-like protein, putative n=1 Tax=Angomonas deanei TaxID=59799 RepID=A0A7G2C0M7_9TRYP|nr:hypothetical protein AGDE_10341 [Angomonas deanei]CAD2213239.1 Vps54-like protein, putative [Angomonas deanei]|eukprot:EPY28670.1 hypothetical protein AGDE_10341 [Angomonas deanei]
MRILSSLVQAMSDHFSSVVLRWVVSVSNVLYPSLQFYTERDTLVSTKTVELCQSLLAEEDSIVCLLIVSRAERRPFSSVEEIERCAQMAYRLRGAAVEFFSRLQHEAPTGPVTNCLSHFSYPPTAVQAAITRHARNYFKLQHARQLEKLTLVLESETWNAKESIDPIFQSYLQTLCGSSEKDVAVFDELAISEQNLVHHAARRNRAKSTAVNRGEDDLLGSMANKLYVSLDGDSDGRIVCDSTLILIELLQSYDTFLGQFPILSFEVTSRTLELISLYDSYTANLILNAEAVKKGTLSTITINNVCIASQPLALLLDFLPLWQQRIMATLRLRSTPWENAPTEESKAATKHTKVESFLENEITTVKKSLKLHREQCLGRASTVVLRKVNSLEAMEKGTWSSKGNEWVMTMLREVARLLRAVKPLLPTGDSHGVVIPLIRALSLKIKEITASIPATETASRELASSDLILFKVNVEKFGYDVLAAVDKGVVETAIAAPSLSNPVAPMTRF